MTRIPAFKEVQTAEELYHWLLKTLQKNAKLGHTCFFPRFNVQHSEDPGLDDQDPGAAVSELRTRLHAITAVVRNQESTIKALRKDGDNVLHSLKHWYAKYQELKDTVDKQPPTLFNTPAKRSALSNSVFLETDYYDFSASMVLDGVCFGVGIGLVGVLDTGGAGSWLPCDSWSRGSCSAALAASTSSLFSVSVMLSSAYTKLMLVSWAYRR